MTDISISRAGSPTDLTAGTAVSVSRLPAAWDEVRARRNALLAACDWTQLADARIDAATRLAWSNYRQALRDVTAAKSPQAVAWPAAPGA